ncbi:MAG TPA: methylated-DNA--[protein]-cysteine S-methyltransferase [Candidatus Eisenbacteria bacterium]|jgi:methylated-DNA-[protein]-cysteine S-methyltransferase
MNAPLTLDLTLASTPVGPMALYGQGELLLGLTLDGGHDAGHPVARHLARHVGAFAMRRVDDAAGAAARLARYFAGELVALDEQPVRLLGTPFQCRVWTALRGIAPGQTTSYSKLARSLESPNAVRAVAAANGANPIAVFVPCHRVIAADGTLWGYGGGLPMKQWLLRHERARFTPLAEQEALPL